MYSPTPEEFRKLAGHGNLIPVTRRLLADFDTPLSAYRKLRGQGESFLFESVEGGEHIGRYSFVGFNPRAIIRQTGSRLEVVQNGRATETFVITGKGKGGDHCVKHGLEEVEKMLKQYRTVSLPSLPRFTGGEAGFFLPTFSPLI